MPGSKPFRAIVRKQILHKPNFLYTALGRPQLLQRVYALVENLGSLLHFAMRDFLANVLPFIYEMES